MFSIVIPLYNKELSVKDTIKSVLNQTFQTFEIIVVNDGSSDGSLEAVESIKDSRIKIFTKENGGVSSARNLGIELSSFEWIAFLDGDDIWEEMHLEEILKMIRLHPNEKLFATSFKKSTELYKDLKADEIYVVNEFFKKAMDTHLIWTSIFVGHASCFIEDKFNNQLAIGEDFELFGRLIKKFLLVKSEKVTAIYRVDAENRSNVGRYKMEKSIFSILDFKCMSFPGEQAYYKMLIRQKIKDFIVKKDYKSLFFLIKKYHFKIFV